MAKKKGCMMSTAVGGSVLKTSAHNDAHNNADGCARKLSKDRKTAPTSEEICTLIEVTLTT